MKLTDIKVQNYKALYNIDKPIHIDDFTCIIGENNSGKSSLLQCVSLFLSGTKLTKDEFYNPNDDIIISVTLSNIDTTELERLNPEHKERIESFINNGNLRLARRYSTDGSSKLRLYKKLPRARKLWRSTIGDALKGKTGAEVTSFLNNYYEEIGTEDERNSIKTQKAFFELLDKHISLLPESAKMDSDDELPTGIDNSIKAILPESIYIAAVKDLSDDIKTKESTPFGKLLNILLSVIEDELVDENEAFELIRKKLNRIENADGTITDDRLSRVKDIESLIQRNLQETFKNVSIEMEIPPPQMKTVLSSATIMADDGVKSSVEFKGDGFRRAIAFSIFRTYMQLSQDATWRKTADDAKKSNNKFVFLFEEPELYLHPRAQNILFDALSTISKRYQVIVTTHSPLFFEANKTTGFIKLQKMLSAGFPKPYTRCLPIDLTDIPVKDQFQLVSFETTNAAFFSRRIVLVEGDTELILFPHIAKLIDTNWDFKASSVSMIKTNGKGSFKRYHNFFNKFEIDVLLICDLDTLIKDFDKLDVSPEILQKRIALLQHIDKIIDDENKLEFPSIDLLKEELQKERFKSIYEKLAQANAESNSEAVISLLRDMLEFQWFKPRMVILKDIERVDIQHEKSDIINALYKEGIFIMNNGCIEDYYNEDIAGADKPTRAKNFCDKINTIKELSDLCGTDKDGKTEFERIFRYIFD
jgi:putative ATP-dependent endonuclease of the OLD family